MGKLWSLTKRRTVNVILLGWRADCRVIQRVLQVVGLLGRRTPSFVTPTPYTGPKKNASPKKCPQ